MQMVLFSNMVAGFVCLFYLLSLFRMVSLTGKLWLYKVDLKFDPDLVWLSRNFDFNKGLISGQVNGSDVWFELVALVFQGSAIFTIIHDLNLALFTEFKFVFDE